MKHAFTLFLVLMASINAYNQSVINRISNGTSYFYYSTVNTGQFIQNVLNEAEHGDTIILPGGLFNVNSGDIVINKRLVIMGAGIHLDSTTVTNRTILEIGNGYNVEFNTGANQVEIHGIVFTGGYVQVTGQVNGLTFVRCEFNLLRFAPFNDDNAPVSNVLIQECVIKTNIEIDGADNVLITNSIIKNLTWGRTGLIVQNCLFLDFNQTTSLNNNGVIYRNNIFTREIASVYSIEELSSFQNNLWIVRPAGSVSLPGGLGTNKSNTNMNNVFVVAPSYTSFDYRANYNLKPGTEYITMATDGKEVGIYGGANPLKNGFHPSNPHWQQLDIPSGTSGGVINNVTIKASAQNN